MESLVTYKTTRSAYGVISINRPQKRNAISLEMADLFLKCIEQAEKQDIKFLVITNEHGPMFCAGGDLNDLHGELSALEAEARLLRMMHVLKKIINFPVPVIALLNGNALGGGCELATACDLRIAKKDTTYGFVQSNIGILPGWGGGAILFKKVDRSFALDWLAKGCQYNTAFLMEKGWLHQTVNPDQWERKEDILKDYLTKSVKQMRLLKDQFKMNMDIESLTEQMRMEVKNTAGLWESPEHKAAVLKFFQRKS